MVKINLSLILTRYFIKSLTLGVGARVVDDGWVGGSVGASVGS